MFWFLLATGGVLMEQVWGCSGIAIGRARGLSNQIYSY